MAEGHLGHCDNELIGFDSQRSEESQQTCHLGLQNDRLWLTGWESPLRGSPEGQRSPLSLGILHGSNMKNTEARHPHVLKDEPMVRLNREPWLELRKGEFLTFGRIGWQFRRISLGYSGKN